ncbi:MAG: hypothetical protein AMXMBFR64_25940 [Myxococcales bacterium]
MRRVLVACLSASVMLLSAVTALAEDPPEAAKAEPKELNFEDDVIETSFLKPDSALIEGEQRKAGGSLLKIRQDFVAEIVKSAEDI